METSAPRNSVRNDSTNTVVVVVEIVVVDDDEMKDIRTWSLSCAKSVDQGSNCLREAGATVYTKHADHPEANVRRPGDAIIPVPDRDFLFSGFRKYLWTRRDAHRRPNAQVPGGTSFMG